MKIIISGLMGPGTLEAKAEPLSEIEKIEKIVFIRKNKGPKINKLKYVVLPRFTKFKIFNVLLTPIFLIHQVFKYSPKLLIGYHILPYAYFVAITGWLTKTPYIIGQTGLAIQKITSKNIFVRKSLKFLFKGAKQINCPGNASKNFWQSVYPSLSHKFVVLHSTVNTDRFIHSSKTKRNYDFIFLGRLAPIKNIDKIIDGFNLLIKDSDQNKHRKLIIVGDGPEKEILELQVAKLGLNKQISFTGFTEHPEKYLNQSKFLIMASTTEGLPTAMMQAMACKTIPISNLVGNIPDLIQNGKTGFVFDSLESDSIKQTMGVAINCDKSTLEKIKLNCRELIAQKHSHKYATYCWKNLFSNLVH